MSKILDFYFEYSSPFAYLASERIEALAAKHNRDIVWHPILLGAVFKVTGQVPLTFAPLKGDYSIRDFTRSAREQSIAYQHPDPFPISAVSACRATLWLRNNDDSALSSLTVDFIHAVYRSFFAQGQDITNAAVLASIASSLGIDAEQMTAGVNNQAVKDALRKEVDDAIAMGVFGAPLMIVDEEPFWGHDRLEQLDRWLTSGGW